MSLEKESSALGTTTTTTTQIMSPSRVTPEPKRYNLSREESAEIYHFQPEDAFSTPYAVQHWGRREPRKPFLIMTEGKETVARAGRPDASVTWRVCVGDYDDDVDIVEQSEVLIVEDRTFSFGFTLPNGQRKICAWEKTKSLIHRTKDIKLVEEKGDGMVLAAFRSGTRSVDGTLDIGVEWGPEFERMLVMTLSCVLLRNKPGHFGHIRGPFSSRDTLWLS